MDLTILCIQKGNTVFFSLCGKTTMANPRMWVRNHLFTFLSLTIKGQPVEKGYLLQICIFRERVLISKVQFDKSLYIFTRSRNSLHKKSESIIFTKWIGLRYFEYAFFLTWVKSSNDYPKKWKFRYDVYLNTPLL